MMALIAQRKRGRSHAGHFRYSGPGDGGPVQFPHGGSGPHRQHGPDAAGRRAGGGQDPSARLLCRDRPRPRHGPRSGGGAAGHEARRPAHSLCLSGGEKAGTDLHHRHCGAAGRPPQHRCYRDLGRRRQKAGASGMQRRRRPHPGEQGGRHRRQLRRHVQHSGHPQSG